MDRYKSFVLSGHVDLDKAISYAREQQIAGAVKIEHQVATDDRAPPTIQRRWTVDATNTPTPASL